MKQQMSKRANVKLSIEIAKPKDEIFPLACPVEELKWIDNWDYTMVYSESGRNELGCIFIEEMSAKHVIGPDYSEKTYWITTKYDLNESIVHFLLVRSSTVTRLEITMEEISPGESQIKWDMTMTSVNKVVNDRFDESLKDRMSLMLTFLGESLKHYCETGNKLIFPKQSTNRQPEKEL